MVGVVINIPEMFTEVPFSHKYCFKIDFNDLWKRVGSRSRHSCKFSSGGVALYQNHGKFFLKEGYTLDCFLVFVIL